MHSGEILLLLRTVGGLVDDVGHPVSEINEDTNYQQLYTVLGNNLMQQLLLMRPVQHENGRFLKIDLVVKSFVVFVQLINQTFTVQ
jgi:hypothetical protein